MHNLSDRDRRHDVATSILHTRSMIMSDNKNDAGKKTDAQSDSEKALQDELRREAAEGKGSVGDAAKNNNLTGSSTWETLPDDDASKKGNK
jgi:hypothetical protein